MKTKLSFRDRWLWGLLVAIVMTFGHSSKVWADGAEMTAQHTVASDSEPYIQYNLYLCETSGSYSHWNNGDFNVYMDGTLIATSADLKFSGMGCSAIQDCRSEDNWHGYTTKNGYFVGAHNVYNGGNSETWVVLYIVPLTPYCTATHTLHVKGSWCNNGSYGDVDLTGSVTFQYSTVDLGTLARTGNRTIGFSGTSNSTSNNLFVDLCTSNTYSSYTLTNKTAASVPSKISYTVENNLAYTFYPRLRRVRTSKYSVADSQPNTTITVYQNYSKVNIPCYPVPTSLNFSDQKWYNKVTTTWDKTFTNTSNCSTDGSFYLFRTDYNNNFVNLGNVNYNNNWSITDADVLLDSTYTYYTVFVPKIYSVPTSVKEFPDSLWKSTQHKLASSFKFSDFTDNPTKDRINLSWNFESMEDAASNSHTIELERRLSSESDEAFTSLKNADPQGIWTISSPNTTKGTYTDKSITNGDVNYTYRLKTTVLGKTWYSDTLCTHILGRSGITGLSASLGTYSGRVRLTWTADQYGTDATYYTVYRRALGSQDEWIEIYKTNGTAVSYNYEDESASPGDYYEYKVMSQVWNTVTGKWGGISEKYTDGFAIARGVISGRVYYDTGTAVDGVRVNLKASNDDGSSNQMFYSLELNQGGYGVNWKVPDAIKGTGKPWTIQLFYRPNTNLSDADDAQLVTSKGNTILTTKRISNDSISYSIAGVSGKKHQKLDEYAQINLVCDGTNIRGILVDKTGELADLSTGSLTSTTALSDTLSFGTMIGTKQAYGYIDELRIWTRALSDTEIKRYCDHTLAGTEDGLIGYMPLDEGITDQKKAYDYSKTNGLANDNYGYITTGTKISTVVPDEEQLNLSATTDINGNYVIRGIPYSGEGTNYSIIPTLGIHEFSPSKQSRYVSTSSQVHSGVDFTDVSSFPVSGFVYYEHTSYPVEGVSFAVDGVTCTKNGNIIKTDENGEYTISVPIGKHYITASLNGHTFVNDGRYPENPDENSCETVVFDQEVSNLTFYDNTLVNIAGRVVGGKDEAEKEIGFGKSVANIGQAKIVMQPVKESVRLNVLVDTSTGSVDFIENTDSLKYGVRGDINSKASVGINSKEATRTVTILTDPKTGEFSALVPPIKYLVTSVTIPSQSEISFGSDSEIIDATGTSETTDSIENDEGGYDKYSYMAKFVKEYDANPTFVVTTDNDTTSAFGEKSVKVDDVEVPLYSVNYSDKGKPGKINYAYNYPIFQMCNYYNYYFYGYEQYVNKDNSVDVYSTRPLAGYVVNVQNEMASTTKVYGASQSNAGEVAECVSDSIILNSDGKAKIRWMAGLPNIIAPYTRTLTITYGESGDEYVWNGNDGDGVGTHGIVLGDLPTGNNFVTEGPNEISMILRDPPGSASQAWFEKGAEVTTSHSYSSTINTEGNATTVTHFGSDTKLLSGFVGVFSITSIESKCDLTVGSTTTNDYSTGSENTKTVTTSDRISTSAEDSYVGHGGDLYMGNSTNLVYGDNRYLAIEKDEDGNYGFKVGDIISISNRIGTHFIYDENYIINTLIPNLEKVRNSFLVDSIDYKPSTTEIQYLSKKHPGEEGYGSDNDDKDVWGSKASTVNCPSYTIEVPDGYEESYSDQIVAYNSWIRNWKKIIARNEEQKVQVQNNREKYLIENVSFSPGAAIEHNSTTQHDTTYVNTDEYKTVVNFGLASGFKIKGTGVTASFDITQGGGFNSENSYGHSDSENYGYALVETGTSDALSVDVFNAPDGYGPIFVTRAGQTSCPFEDEVKTMYYRNAAGNPAVISAKTMQVEKPELTAEPYSVTGVPCGKEAQFTVKLSNNSETGESTYYNLSVNPESNPYGAAVKLNGKNILDGTSIFCEAGKTLSQTLTISQTDLSVMDYDGIELVLSSTCDDNVSSSILLYATFVPAGADIDLAVSPTNLNLYTDTCVTVTAKNFDPNYSTLKNVKLQYRRVSDTNWTNILTCPKDSLSKKMNSRGELVKVFNMKDVMDGEFEFRAITECSFGEEMINGESDPVTLIKDVARPQLISVPSPSDGIFNYGDEISLTFNEDIQKDALTKADYFRVAGVLNGAEVNHDVALQMNGTAAAQTEARIDLSNRAFTVETWLYWSEAGTFLQHGSAENNMQFGVDADGHLTVTYGGNTYTSTNTIPQKEWIYLVMSLGSDSQNSSIMLLNADCLNDKNEIMLFRNEQAGIYTGNGILTLGKSLKGMMHELTLWNTARSKVDGQSQMYDTKSNYTQGLIGYWQLGEGHGTFAEDRSRSRNMTVADNGWYIYGTNYVMELDGTVTPATSIGSISTTSDESYMIEGWFRANEEQSDAHLLTTSNGTIDLYINEAGGLELNSISGSGESTATSVSSTDMRDNEWHHIALNVLKSTNGNATVYVDGSAVKTISASLMPSLQADKLYIGKNFKGGIDEIRIWNGRRTADVIKNIMYTRVSADEPGLVAYFPMDTTFVNIYSLKEQKAVFTDAAQHCGKITELSNASLGTSYTDTPPVKAIQSNQNVSYSFVASERKILFDLEQTPSKIEGCTIYFTAKGVLDAHGNDSEPVTWSAYIQQNQLKWGESEVNVRKLDGEDYQFDVTIRNNGGTTQNWVISNLPSWLSVDSESGTLDALGSQTVTFTVSAATPVGSYESTIYLTGSMDIDEPLVINLTSAVAPPDWAVNTSGYMNTMNIIGQLKVDGKLSEDSEDIVAAFRGSECVGVASPAYMKKYDSYFILMNVYGNEDDADPLTFKVFDASTGTTYPLVTTENPESIYFTVDGMEGKFASPVIFNPEDAIEQNLDLREGYTWVSIYVTPKDASLGSIFKNNTDNVTAIKGKSASSNYSSSSWHGTLSEMAVGDMYKVNAKTAAGVSVIGKPVTPTAVEMSIYKDWNWIGYNCGSTNSLENAFADLSPEDGDIVKSQSAFSVYSDGEWVGTLSLMSPGLGYCYCFNTEDESAVKTFHYPTVSASSKKMPRKVQAEGQFSNTQYESNMTIMAVVMNGDQVVSNAEVSVYADGELRAASTQAVRDDIHFLTVGGNRQTGALRFVVTVDGFDYLLDAAEMFVSDGVSGSLTSPLVLQMGEATGIKHITDGDGSDSDNLFDVSGRRINRLMQKSVYIQNGVKRLSK